MCKACDFDDESALVCEERLPDYLQQLYLFRDLGREQFEQILTGHRSMKLDDGRWLYREGDLARRFYIVREGQIALFRQSQDGRESIVAIVGTDEVFGEELLFQEDAQHELNAKVIGACTLLAIDRRAFRGLLSESIGLCHRVMTTLHKRQQMLLDHIEGLTLKDATQRLVSYLLKYTENDDAASRLRLSVPKSTLAAHLSIQPETLSRILTRLKECHHLREEGDHLVIVSPEEMAEGHGCSFCHLRYWGCPGPKENDRLKKAPNISPVLSTAAH